MPHRVFVASQALQDAYRHYRQTELKAEHADEFQIAIYYWLKGTDQLRKYAGGFYTGSDRAENQYELLLFERSEVTADVDTSEG